MKYLWAIPFFLVSIFSCKNKPATNSAKAATDSSKFYPLADFIQEQIAYVDLRNFEIFQKHQTATKTDSSIISKEQFKQLAASFLSLDICKPDKKHSYTETVFQDLSTASYTLNYKASQASDLVKNMDILLDEQTKMVKRVFIVSEFQKADTNIMEHHNWTANKQFQITRTIETAGGRSNETTTVYWIRK
jgi:hypothetical protein